MRVLVADDEQVARNRLVRLLAVMDDVEVVGQCESGREVIDRVAAGDVDVVLLDIQMAGLSGLETAALLPEGGPIIVLCTAHPDHALTAFELGAADYVTKPVEAGRLRKALSRARERLAGAGRTQGGSAIMDGGGNDLLINNSQCLTTPLAGDTSCHTAIQGTLMRSQQLLMDMNTKGVQHIVFYFYPDLDSKVSGHQYADAWLDYAYPQGAAMCCGSSNVRRAATSRATATRPGAPTARGSTPAPSSSVTTTAQTPPRTGSCPTTSTRPSRAPPPSPRRCGRRCSNTASRSDSFGHHLPT